MKTVGLLFVLGNLIGFSNSVNAKESVEYFESICGCDLSEIGAIGDYENPDQFFQKIAVKLGIDRLALEKVKKSEGWNKSNSVIIKGIIRRIDDRWVVLVFRISKLTDEGKPDFESYEERYVQIDDRKEITYYGENEPKKVE